jgi:hypothetical protein
MPSKANSVFEVESRLKDVAVKTMKDEQRTKLLSSLVRKKLTTREVDSFLNNQKWSRGTGGGDAKKV